VIITANASVRRDNHYLEGELPIRQLAFLASHNFESVRLRTRLKIVTLLRVPTALYKAATIFHGAYSTIYYILAFRKTHEGHMIQSVVVNFRSLDFSLKYSNA
jgi:hypothetical protein